MNYLDECEKHFSIINNLELNVRLLEQNDGSIFWFFENNKNLENKYIAYKELTDAYRKYVNFYFDRFDGDLNKIIFKNNNNINNYVDKFNKLDSDYRNKIKGFGMVIASNQKMLDESHNVLNSMKQKFDDKISFYENETDMLERTIENLSKKLFNAEDNISKLKEKTKFDIDELRNIICMKDNDIQNMKEQINEQLNNQQEKNKLHEADISVNECEKDELKLQIKELEHRYKISEQELDDLYSDHQASTRNCLTLENAIFEQKKINDMLVDTKNDSDNIIKQMTNSMIVNENKIKTLSENEITLQKQINKFSEDENKYLALLKTYIAKMTQQKKEIESLKCH